jgi:arylsulfatase
MKTPRPNILFINTDQLRADHLGCYGHPLLPTPNIDRLANEGVMFDFTCAQCAICSPARYSLLSGCYVKNHGAHINNVKPYPETKSLIENFNNLGYRTTCLGKLHHDPPNDPFGFQKVTLFDGFPGVPGRYEKYEEFLKEKLGDNIDLNDLFNHPVDMLSNSEKRNRVYGPCLYGTSKLPENLHFTTWLTDLAFNEIRQWSSDEPQFLYLSYVAPHSPYNPPVPYDCKYDTEDVPLPSLNWEQEHKTKNPHVKTVHDNTGGDRLNQRIIQEARANYLGLINHLDTNIGRVLDLLEKLDLHKSTLIMLTSDHGDFMGEHGVFQKHFLYDGAIRIPWLVRYPGQVPKNKKIYGMVNQIDQIPTCLGLIGGNTSLDNISGSDRSQLICSEETTSTEEAVYSEHTFVGVGKMDMVRTNTDKLCSFQRNDDNSCHLEYYDLLNDPLELKNIINVKCKKRRIDYLRKLLFEFQSN